MALRILILFINILLLLSLAGCAAFGKKEEVFAVVNGESITEGDLAYSLNIAHRREGLSATKMINISDYMQKLIDDRLIMQEAYRMELDRLPEIQQALEAFILRESVVRLYKEEIVNKVSVSEEDIRSYYKKNYKDAPDEELEKIRDNIKRDFGKTKEKERSAEYLKLLREQSSLKIHSELLAAVKLDVSDEEKEKMLHDKTPLVEVHGSVLTIGEFAQVFLNQKQTPELEKIKENILNNWIDYKLIDYEALRRHYELRSDLKDMLENYKDHLLKNMFITRIIVPKIEISDKTLNDYYTSHQKDFLSPRKYRIQKIILKTVEDAKSVLNSLQNGADFAWMMKNKPSSEGSGDAGWLTKNELPEPAREIAETLKPGEISPVLELEAKSRYMIIRLVERTGDEVEKFSSVKGAIANAVFNAKFKELFDKHVEQLKADAEIKVHHDAIKSFEQRFRE